MRNISKAFNHVPVLHGIDLDLRAGESLVLAGENGAGKSTLMKILSGVYSPDAGSIRINDADVTLRGPLDAEAHGIAIIHQELSVIGSMSVQDNLFLGHELTRLGMLRQHEMAAAAQRLLCPLGLDIDVARPLEHYPIAVRQLVEIARATSRHAKVIVMDEPTSSLADNDVARLMQIICDLKAKGTGIIFISHKMSEIYEVADRIMVMRDGRHVATDAASAMSQDALVTHLVGRELNQQIKRPPELADNAETVLKVEDMTLESPTLPGQFLLHKISFTARRGEILGFSGLQGSGCSEIFVALFGGYGRRARAVMGGAILSHIPASPREAVRRGIAYLPADRKESGLVLQMPVTENITLASLPRFSPMGWLKFTAEQNTAAGYIKSLRIRCAGPRQPVCLLSGGNQQKVLLARCLETRPSLLLLDEPTRGVDVGAKHEIYDLIARIRAEGTTILLTTTELPEMLGLADRICVLHRGRITRTLDRFEATQENILAAAMGEKATVH